MPNSTSFYDILGVSRDADDNTIKKAYRTLSLQHHPDRNPAPEAKARFQEINEAYEHLSDPQRRAQYNMELDGGGGGGIGVGMGGFHHAGMPPDIEHMFNMMFSGGMFPGMHVNGGNGPEIHIFHGGFPGGMAFQMGGEPHVFRQIQKPQPIVQSVSISFEQAYNGCTLHIGVEKWVMRDNVRVNEIEVVYLTIPPGTDSKETIIMVDKGHVASEQVKGDVKFVIEVQNNTQFTRSGMDLIYKKQISLKEALTGFAFEVPHVNGKLLAINNKTNNTVVHPQYKKVIPGLGIVRNTNKGNLIIEFDVHFPETLTKEQMEAIANIL